MTGGHIDSLDDRRHTS